MRPTYPRTVVHCYICYRSIKESLKSRFGSGELPIELGDRPSQRVLRMTNDRESLVVEDTRIGGSRGHGGKGYKDDEGVRDIEAVSEHFRLAELPMPKSTATMRFYGVQMDSLTKLVRVSLQ